MFYNIRANRCNVLSDTKLDERHSIGINIHLRGESPQIGLKTALKNVLTFLDMFHKKTRR